MGKLIAQFECELAERQRASGDIDAARAADRARLRGRLRHRCAPACSKAASKSKPATIAAAIRAFERVARTTRISCPKSFRSCCPATSASATRRCARSSCSEMIEHYRGVSPVLALTQLVEAEEGVAAARATSPSN